MNWNGWKHRQQKEENIQKQFEEAILLKALSGFNYRLQHYFH